METGCTKCKSNKTGKSKFAWMYVVSLYVFLTSVYGNIKLFREVIVPWVESLF
jgi:hypothetical protein